MKNFLLLFLSLLLVSNIYSQDIKEKKILNLEKSQYSAYDIKYDKNSGTYVYAFFDTVKNKTIIKSNKGTSPAYDYVSFYNAIFDNDGNYYMTAANYNESFNIDKAFFLKNGVALKEYNSINYSFLKKNNNIYFVANNNGKDIRVIYDIQNGVFKNSNPYDTITLGYMDKPDDIPMEGEIMYDLGFTKDGRDFFIGTKGDKQMIVLNNEEQKAYDRIESTQILLDNDGMPAYIAKVTENGKNSYFAVQGTKEYDRLPYALMPMIFDASNTPYYIATDKADDYSANSRVMKGNEVYSKTFNNGIFDLGVTPDGKVYFVGNDTLGDGRFISTLYIDNKEVASNSYLWGIQFKKDGTPVYVASDMDNGYYVSVGNKPVSDKYSYIYNLKIKSNGELAYSGMNYSESEDPGKSSALYYFDGKKKIGPFYNMMMSEYMPDYLNFNDKGDYVYVGTEVSKKKDGNTKMYVVNKDWSSPKFDYVSEVLTYKNDFYFNANNYNEDKSTNYIFKNGEQIGEEYESINEFKIDKEKGILSFIGVRDNKAYYCEVKL